MAHVTWPAPPSPSSSLTSVASSSASHQNKQDLTAQAAAPVFGRLRIISSDDLDSPGGSPVYSPFKRERDDYKDSERLAPAERFLEEDLSQVRRDSYQRLATTAIQNAFDLERPELAIQIISKAMDDEFLNDIHIHAFFKRAGAGDVDLWREFDPVFYVACEKRFINEDFFKYYFVQILNTLDEKLIHSAIDMIHLVPSLRKASLFRDLMRSCMEIGKRENSNVIYLQAAALFIQALQNDSATEPKFFEYFFSLVTHLGKVISCQKFLSRQFSQLSDKSKTLLAKEVLIQQKLISWSPQFLANAAQYIRECL